MAKGSTQGSEFQPPATCISPEFCKLAGVCLTAHVLNRECGNCRKGTMDKEGLRLVLNNSEGCAHITADLARARAKKITDA